MTSFPSVLGYSGHTSSATMAAEKGAAAKGAATKVAVATAVLTAAVLIAAPAVSQEYCVTCSGPDALYRCVIIDPRPGAVPSLQATCLGTLAKAGGHAQCAVKANVTVFQCDAPVKRISLAEAEPVLLPPPAAPVQNPNEPPKTLVEAVKRGNEATKQQFEKSVADTDAALKATGSFFKKSLTCLGSLFTRCE